MTTIRLTPHELRHAVLIGANRHLVAIEQGKKSNSKDPWGAHIRGAIAEMAVAKHLGRYWFGLEDTSPGPGRADIGESIQVRSTTTPNGHLPIYGRDPDDHVFILAHVDGLEVRLIGHTHGKNGKRDEWWRAQYKAYWVPQDHLVPFERISEFSQLRLSSADPGP